MVQKSMTASWTGEVIADKEMPGSTVPRAFDLQRVSFPPHSILLHYIVLFNHQQHTLCQIRGVCKGDRGKQYHCFSKMEKNLLFKF